MSVKDKEKYRFVTGRGKLTDSCLPAIYFDSSVVIDYWSTEGFEIDAPDDIVARIAKQNEPKEHQVIRDLFKTDKRFNNMIAIRKKLTSGESKFTAVISPLGLLEIMEWNAEASFKQMAVEAIGALPMQRKGKKEIGDYLKKLMALRTEEVRNLLRTKKEYSTGLEIIMSKTWLNGSFAECHGLQGLLQADIVNFKLTIAKALQEPSAYAYLQLGAADILHIQLAKHFGCSYIASFDDDFRRAKEIIEKETKMILLCSPEEILRVLK